MNGQFNGWFNRAVSDLHMMVTELPTGPYPYAGTAEGALNLVLSTRYKHDMELSPLGTGCPDGLLCPIPGNAIFHPLWLQPLGRAVVIPPKQTRRQGVMTGKTVAVVGASGDRSKYGNKAVRAFRDAGWAVFPIHPTLEEVEGITAYPDLDAVPVSKLDQVSFYVPPQVGIRLLDQVARKGVGEVWLNPGSESPEMVTRASARP